MRFFIIVAVQVAYKYVERNVILLGPGVNGEMGFSKEDNARDAVTAVKLVKLLAHGGERGGLDGVEAVCAEQINLGHQCMIAAVV